MRWDHWSEKRVRRCWRLRGSISERNGGEVGREYVAWALG